MSLRITHALKEKHDQYLARLENGSVGENEPYVIAIDRCALEHVEGIAPIILRVVYGIGNLTLSISVPVEGRKPDEQRNWEKAESIWQRQEAIAKKNGEEISSMFFLNPEHAGISAVIYSINTVLALPRQPHEMGESFIVAHNPHARNPIIGELPFGIHHTWEETGVSQIRPPASFTSPDPFEDIEGGLS